MTNPSPPAGLVSLLTILFANGVLAATMYLPSLPTIGTEMGVAAEILPLTLTVYFLTFAGGQLIYGPLSDRYGRRPLLLGGLVGVVRHRRIGWKLDADGFAIRRGGLWRVETLVPVSRVQHLDLERGPLERRLGLATLVVHTDGTRLAAVRLPLLALEDAEALRAHLARQVESDDAL